MSNQSESKEITIAQYMKSPEMIARFSEVLGLQAKSYLQSVLIAVYSNKELSECTHKSIASSALRAASLELSCDPAVRQAHLVPYNKSVKTDNGWIKVKEAQFQPHYNGLYTLAMRTGKYFVINVSPVHKDWEVMENIRTGLHAIVYPGLGRLDDGYIPSRKVAPEDTAGWLGYFETTKGFKKSVYMTVEEIEAHARKYSKSYDNPKSLWKSPDHKPTMQMKTVLLSLLRWADLSGKEHDALRVAMESENVIDAEASDISDGIPDENEVTVTVPGPRRDEKDNLRDLGFEPNIKPGFNPVTIETRVPEKLKADLTEDAKVERGIAGDGKLGLVVSIIDKTIGKTGRYDLTEYLFGVRSSTQLKDNQVHALFQWLDPVKDKDTNAWIPSGVAIQEMQTAYQALLKAAGQQTIPGMGV